MTPRERKARRRDLGGFLLILAVFLVAAVAAVAGLTALAASGSAERAARDAKRAAKASQRAIANVAREGRERRDQTCRLFEGQHLADVNRLKRTYTYLEHLPPTERGTTLTVAVVRQLPEIETDARVDSAPPYCDEPGEKAERLWNESHGRRGAPPIGLPEPDPTLPERRDFRHLLKRGQ